MDITLGSTSIHKLDAVRRACERICMEAKVTGVAASSGQNAQPVGWDEAFLGALARAREAQARHPESVAIGIESGIFFVGSSTLDMAVIVILTRDRRQIITTSTGFQLPEERVRIARSRGFADATVASVIAEKFGGDPGDPHSALSGGKVSRTGTLIDALAVGLLQI